MTMQTLWLFEVQESQKKLLEAVSEAQNFGVDEKKEAFF